MTYGDERKLSSGVIGDARPSGESSLEETAPALSRTERIALFLVSLVQASLLVWAAWVLPWASWTIFSGAALLAALGHFVLLVSVVIKPERALSAFRLSAFASLLLLAVVSVSVVDGSVFLVAVYGPLGQGLSAIVAAVWALFFLFTGPTAIWGLVRSRGHGPRLPGWRRMVCLSVLASGLLVVYGVRSYLAASLEPEASPLEAGELRELAATRVRWAPSDEEEPRVGLEGVTACKEDFEESRFTLLVTTSASAKEQSSSKNDTGRRCFQGGERAVVLAQAREYLASMKSPGPVVLDWVLGTQKVSSLTGLLSSLVLRPGVDGLCENGRCLLPWQLLAHGDFTGHRPLGFVADLRFGVALQRLRRKLVGHREEERGGLSRFETQNFVLRDGQYREMRRMRPLHLDGVETEGGRAELSRASRLAEGQIVSAQEKDGRFRYVLDPFSGEQRSREYSLARQAGTLLALCELGQKAPGVERAIARGLGFLQKREIVFDEGRLSALAPESDATVFRVGDSALSLVAFARCRPRVGEKYDGLIARLSAFLLTMQGPDGVFRPEYRFAKAEGAAGRVRAGRGRVVRGREPLFVSGQAVLAFILLQKSAYGPATLSRAKMREAAQKTMDDVGHRHWSHGLSSFFFIEENWHCLAAREALDVQRHDRYEQFCLDFMRFKSRLILDDDGSTPREFVGGHGLGSIVPPHNTASSGFAESMAAAVVVARARGEGVDLWERKLKDALGFILRQQWTPENGYACRPEAIGAFSEQTHIPEVRIDFVQHAWSGLAHGAEALAL